MSNLSLNHSSKVAHIDPAAGTGGGELQACSKPRLLVVDDVADNRNILSRRFQRCNFDIVEADCGTRALELVAASSFDAILLDVNMPYMSGLEVLQEIRRKHSPEALPVIMVTANNQSADIVAALEMGANDYVAKPVQFSVALARVNAQVERKHASEALALANAALNQSNEQLERRVSERTARLVEANQQLKTEVRARQPPSFPRRVAARAARITHHPGLFGGSPGRSRRIQKHQRRVWPFRRRRPAEGARQPDARQPRELGAHRAPWRR